MITDEQKKIVGKLVEELPQLSEMEKGYLLGFTEAVAARSKKKEEEADGTLLQ